MIYFSFKEIILASICFFSFGALCGGAYLSVNKIFLFIRIILKSPFCVHNMYIKGIDYVKNSDNEKKKDNLSDFLFFCFVGIFYVILNYLTLDAEVRLFTFIFFTIGYFLSFYTFGKLIARIIEYLLNVIECIYFRIVYYLFLPLVIIVKLFKKIIGNLLNKAFIALRRRRLNNIFLKKRKEIRILKINSLIGNK